ncbi:MAG: hypothetical protein IT440_13440 [Phycisphaeraceae bacterium]|nr:hypothetical protein [Phycisphaeraceae bacterium]
MLPDADSWRDLRDGIDATRRRLRISLLAVGLSLFVALPAAWLLLLSLTDLVMPLPVSLRIAAAMVFYLLASGLLAAGVLWPLGKPISRQQVALRIERSIPGMHNRLITVLDMAQHPREGIDEAFVRRLIDQTRAKMRDYHVSQVVSPVPARRCATIASAVMMIALLAAGLLWGQLPIAAARILLPTAAIAPASWIQLAVMPGHTQVLEGEPLAVDASVLRGHAEELSLVVWAQDGRAVRYPMQPATTSGTDWRFTLPAVTEDLRYRVEGGGTWTTTWQVSRLRRPVIHKVDLAVIWPAYTQMPQPQPVDPEAVQVSAPAGSTLLVKVAASADAADGQVQWLEAREVTREDRREVETVWFDDDPPADAAIQGNWRWLSGSAFSGLRCYTCSFDHKPFGLTTRLSPLTLGPDQKLVLHVRPDDKHPAGRLIVSVDGDQGKTDLSWDSLAMPLPQEVQKTPGYMGLLPKPGTWTRLTVSPAQVDPRLAGKTVKLTGIRFTIEGGDLLLDRIGAVRDVVQQVTGTELKPAGMFQMLPDREAGSWIARVPVEADGHFSVSLRDAGGHASFPTRPLAVVATADQPPVVVVEKPGQSVTLDHAEPLPVMARTFDDLGVMKAGLQTGSAPQQWDAVRWLDQPREPDRTRTVLAAVDPASLKLSPGQSVYYRMVVEDSKGQQSVSEAYRLSLAGEAGKAAAAPPAQRDLLRGLLEGLDKLTQVQASAAATVGKLLLAPLTEGEGGKAGVAVSSLKLLNPDGSPLSGEQLQSLYKQQLETLAPKDRQAWLDQAQQAAQRQHEQVHDLSEQFAQAAKAAEQSPASLPMEAQALRMMSGQLLSSEGDPAQLQLQLQSLMASGEQLVQQPQVAQDNLAAIMTQLQAQQALEQGTQVRQQLVTQREQLDQMRQQVEGLRQQVSEAKTARELEQISRQQAQLDPALLKQMAQARELAPPPTRRDDMPAPWEAPGQRMEELPVEKDTPEEKPIIPAKPAAKPTSPEPSPAPREELAWWDKPVDELPTIRTMEKSQRYADRDTRPVERPAPRPASGATPRQQLMRHQDAMAQQLTEDSNALAAVGGQIDQTMQQTRQFLDRMSPSVEGPSAAAGASPMTPEQARQQLQQLLASQPMRMLSSMAGQMAAMNGLPGRTSATVTMQPGVSNGAAGDQGGQVYTVDLSSLDLTAGQRASLYRLPPQLRVPLVESMKEKGPEAYQPLIDAYYRQLSDKVQP